jgi:hypothetical protein
MQWFVQTYLCCKSSGQSAAEEEHSIASPSQHIVFPNKKQKFILTCCKPFIRLLASLEYCIKFEQDPSDFFAGSKKLSGRLFAAFLSRFGPRPEKTNFNIQAVRKFLGG